MRSPPRTQVTLPELALIAGTRMMLGGGIGLLLSGRLSEPQRRAVGWTLFMIGAATTVPLAAQVLSRRRALKAAAASDDQPAATTG